MALIFVSEGAEATWEQMDDVPSLYSEVECSYYDSESDRGILVEEGGTDYNDVWAYDHNSDNWTQMDDVPSLYSVHI